MSDLSGYYDFPVPDELREVALRHQQHVAELISKLRMVGMDNHLIEQSVDQLIASYRAQLLQAVRAVGDLCRAD